MKTKELAELLERATKSSDPWASRVAFAIIQENSKDFAAELIRCRELLAEMVSCAFKDDADEQDHMFMGHDEDECAYCKAKKYLSETEG